MKNDEKIRVGILTWTRNNNYGTILQALSLSRITAKMGWDTTLIDYAPTAAVKIKNQLKWGNPFGLYISKMRRVMSERLHSDSAAVLLKKQRMRVFLQGNANLSQEVRTPEELSALAADFDVIICGSDQIWTPVSFNPEYYLDFAEGARKIAYAPSFGVEFIPERKKDTIARLLKDFDRISVRETHGARMINELTGIAPEVTADPVILLGGKSLEKYAAIPETDQKYVFCYMLERMQTFRAARTCAAHLGVALRCINESTERPDAADGVMIDDAGPAELLGLIKCAEAVVTDSYHGLLLSVLFGKKVHIIRRFDDSSADSQNSRIDSFLELMGISYKECRGFIGEKEFEKINERLPAFRTFSLEWLNAALEGGDSPSYSEMHSDGRETATV